MVFSNLGCGGVVEGCGGVENHTLHPLHTPFIIILLFIYIIF
tara:strand:+ start:423 stop:548 length:126 start_codon:yes stop_codon:yes gene_type:complete